MRSRISKGLVEKGVLRTEKVSYLVFDLPSHPVQDTSVKKAIVQRVVDCLLGRSPPDKKTVALVCAAYAANVLDNALTSLSFAQREQAFKKVDEILQECANYSERAKTEFGITQLMAGYCLL